MLIDTAPSPSVVDPSPQIRRLRSQQEVVAALEQDLPYTVYILAELKSFWWGESEWYLWQHGDQRTLCRYERTRSPQELFLMGATVGVAPLLQTFPLPWEIRLTCLEPHSESLQAAYRLSRTQTMLRMVVTPATFRPAPGATTRLEACHLGALNNLYRGFMSGVLAAHYLQEGVYYGIWEGLELVAVAGTHFIDDARGIAAVGNVFTQPQCRNRGYATLCTSAVTAKLLESCQQVILSVDPDNTPARRAYARLGYQPHCWYVSGRGTLRPASRHRALAWVRGLYRRERSNGE